MSVPSLRDAIAARRIDPLAPGTPGLYADHLVRVVREPHPVPSDGPRPIVRTAHFVLRRRGRRVELGHRLRPDQLDNDLAGLLDHLVGEEVVDLLADRGSRQPGLACDGGAAGRRLGGDDGEDSPHRQWRFVLVFGDRLLHERKLTPAGCVVWRTQ